ncbi:MAG: 1-acyl-sn-glycerol-3-phosphate acyltransferase [Bacteroidetes bacterium]|nr:1-acyl-sn-glycerol-3-phosphate acyltransferase [Bacteroidota bacterium]
MIRNQKSFFYRGILHYYVRWIVGRHFHDVKFNTVDVDPNKSILLIANHFSFWDALILYCVNIKLFKKKFHVMVREDTTVKLHYLKFGGAFSIKKRSKDMLRSLDYASQLLHEPGNLVLIFPQGKLYSCFADNIVFEKGLMRVADGARGKFQLIFAATFIQYLKGKKPDVTVYLKNEECEGTKLEELRSNYQRYYSAAKTEQSQITL